MGEPFGQFDAFKTHFWNETNNQQEDDERNTMKTPLPEPITPSLQATNVQNTVALLACFTADAVITDEGQKYHGVA
jgi:hypothetical protein